MYRKFEIKIPRIRKDVNVYDAKFEQEELSNPKRNQNSNSSNIIAYICRYKLSIQKIQMA